MISSQIGRPHPKGVRYYVAKRGKAGGMSLVNPGCNTVEEARGVRATIPDPQTGIYKIEWGKIPEFVEGVNLG